MSRDVKKEYAAGSPNLAARRGCRGVRRADRRIRRAGLSVPRGDAGIDFSQFPICKTASNAPALTGRATKAEIVMECRRGLPRAASSGDRSRHSSRSTISTSNWSITAARPTSCWRRSRPASRDAGLGMALRWLKPLEQGFDVKIAAGTHGGCMRVLSRANSRRRQARRPQGQDRRRSAISADRTRTSSRSSSPSRASIRSRTSTGASIPAICCSSPSRRAKSRRSWPRTRSPISG